MKPSFILTALFIGSVPSLFAGQPVKEVVATTASGGTISQEFEANYGVSAAARSNVSPTRNANVSEQSAHVEYVLSYAVPERPIIRLGAAYDRFDFDLKGRGFIPSALQSANLVVGIDFKIHDILLRIEAEPGFFGDDRGFNSSDFNVPVVLGGSYIVSKDFQWVAGLYFNPNAYRPVTGGAGFRWQMSDRWVLNAVPPNPRLEYRATDDLTLYAGGQIIVSTFRVNKNFGSSTPGRNYRNALVDYTEIRAGTGASWKLGRKGALDLEVGYMPYRDFDFHKVGDNYQTKSGAIYGQAGIKLNF